MNHRAIEVQEIAKSMFTKYVYSSVVHYFPTYYSAYDNIKWKVIGCRWYSSELQLLMLQTSEKHILAGQTAKRSNEETIRNKKEFI